MTLASGKHGRKIRLRSRGSPGADLPLLFKGLHRARLCLSPHHVQFKQLFRVDLSLFHFIFNPFSSFSWLDPT